MAESMRTRMERDEDERLAAHAVRSADATRRHAVPVEGRGFDYRTGFQRDRDRVVYSRAFRRLRQKAQLGILPDYEDHRRNRLTHTLEVTQLARTVGRALRLNEDLVEAVSLAHDLGQPPFGPAGELALDDLLAGRLDGHGGTGLGDLGGFRHTVQGLRVVDLLEKRYKHPGLNLSDPVREGILKSGPIPGPRPVPDDAGLRPGLAPAFEVQAVLLADRIATALHDLDDALQSRVVEPVQVERLPAVGVLRRRLGRSYPTRAGRFMKANAIHRGLVHLLVTDAIVASERRLDEWADRYGVSDPERFREVRDEAVRGDEIAAAPTGARMLDEIEDFLESRVRRGYDADRVAGWGRRVLLGLFAAYLADPTLLEDHVLLRFKQSAGGRFLRDLPRSRVEAELTNRYRRNPRFVRLLVDHLAAMTDAYAMTEHRRLLEMGAVPIPGAEQLRREDELL